MTEIKNCKKKLVLAASFIIFFIFPSFAQLKADFSIDKNGGCSPLTVSFTNATTGASSSATYQWDFGNGNTSTLMNAGATYVDEQTYTIKLTVSDGTQSSAQTKQITVYKRPTVDFSFDVTKGCAPIDVAFSYKSSPGDGTIQNYFWDYGDGSTQQLPNGNQTTHTYNFAQRTTVSLTAINSYGCQTTIIKDSVLNVLPTIKANFAASTTYVCNEKDPVNFTNSSVGPGTLNYQWDFGDGNSSTVAAPVHTYNKKGTYTVALTVSNADGCSNTNTQTNYLNVHDFETDFDVPSLICTSATDTFINRSTRSSTVIAWFMDTIYSCGSCYGDFAYFSFQDTLKHTIQLVTQNGTCMDTATKIVSAKLSPFIKPFIVDMPVNCGPPVIVHFKDTTKDVVRWLWEFEGVANGPTSTLQNPSYNYTYAFQHEVLLTVSNAVGCNATEYGNVSTNYVYASINVADTDILWACDSVHVNFSASASDSIIQYQWDFGDGSTSAQAAPHHTFTNEGNQTITLKYVTKNGCTGAISYGGRSIYVSKVHPIDISVSPGTTICGNNLVTFTLSGNGNGNYYWNFGDDPSYSFGGYINSHIYSKDSVYSISVIYSDYLGLCTLDTFTKKDFIKVLPPFPKISQIQNTCDGTRGLVTFQDGSYKALTSNWNFGDGSPDISYTIPQHQVIHTYAKTGNYKVTLTTTNGQCTVQDSEIVYVLLKQNPLLTSDVANTCSNGIVNITVSNMETSPRSSYTYDNLYKILGAQYGDSSSFNGRGLDYYNYYGWLNGFSSQVSAFDASKNDFRIITTSEYFGCTDTSNFIKLKISGAPTARFKILPTRCINQPTVFIDSSTGFNNVPIVTWNWSFGDGQGEVNTKGDTVLHQYKIADEYSFNLLVTDANGCTDNLYIPYFNIGGVRAAFTMSASVISPNTTVQFSNNSFDNDLQNSTFKWDFGDGTSSTETSPQHQYIKPGTYSVMLIATNNSFSCSDTMVQTIVVKYINAAFQINTSSLNKNNCLPVLVQFTNTSSNAAKVLWDFGDGSIADNVFNPSHLYSKPGAYLITLHSYSDNGTEYITIDSVFVNSLPSPKIKANIYFGCTLQLVTLNAETHKGNLFSWDFGDGAVVQSKDSFATHPFANAGVYMPTLIMSDSNGCTAVSDSSIKIVIDSLSIDIGNLPSHLCDSAQIYFNPYVVSVAADQAQQTLTYSWDFGTGNVADISDIKNPTFVYKSPGTYTIHFNVSSPYGCAKQTTKIISVYKSAKASIAGPTEICQNASAQFNGSASLSDNIEWKWIFGNGDNSAIQNPPQEIFNDSGIYKVLLVVNHSGCYDTAYNNLVVHGKPNINVDPKQSILCLGNSVQLNAHDGISYSWSPANGLNDNKSASPIASPSDDITYVVLATNNFNCTSTDSASIKVAKPFKVKIPADTFVCKGSSIMLPVAGANSYSWISGDGLSSTTIANPVALPTSSAAFTVVGYDAYNCFTDTETVHINVQPLPTVSAGPDINALDATSVQLNATGSSDITQWNWIPPDNLSCADCAAPISTAKKTTEYIVTVKNQYDCIASDTVIVKLTCTQDHVYIPSAFSPDGNGSNDVFYIKGRGVSIIKSFKIYGRWGEVVFERKNINIDDRSNGWDGNYKGQSAPIGTYVYMAELVCDTGELFVMKGTVTLVR